MNQLLKHAWPRAVLLMAALVMASATLCHSQPLSLEGELIGLSRHAWRGELLGSDMAIGPSRTTTTGEV